MELNALIKKSLGYFTVAFTLAFLFVFLILPVAVIVRHAFLSEDGFTLSYFFLLFENQNYVTSIVNSFLIGVCATIVVIVVSMPIALINARYDYPGKALLSGALLLPMMMPPFVGAIGMQRLLARMGSLNLMLLDWGLITEPIEWLAEGNKFWAVVALEAMSLYPIMYLNLAAALANVDPSVEEAATVLGAGKLRRWKDIVLPLALPGLFAGSVIVFIWAVTDLGTPLLVGMQDVMPVRIFTMVTDVNENPVGYALVFCVICMTVGVFLASKFAFGRKKYEMMAKGHVTSATQPASLLSSLIIYPTIIGVILLAMIPHITVIITSFSDNWFMTAWPEQYTLEHYRTVIGSELPLIGLQNSLTFAAASTVFDVILGLLVAYVVTRRLVPMASLLDSIVMIPLALPGIVLAFGYVVTFSDTPLDPLHNPIPLLIIAYAIRRLPFMVRSATAGLQQISASLEEASWIFGASRFHTFRKITAPLIMANVVAGALLCFSYAMLDVSDSLILAMKNQYYPLTKAIYALFLEQGQGELIASALGVISMVILGACILGASLILGKKMGELFRSA